MFVKTALLVWSGLAVLWWMISWWLVRADASKPRMKSEDAPPPEGAPVATPPPRQLTIFKPLPPQGAGRSFDPSGIESFLAQLDDEAELLLGVHEVDRAQVEPWLTRAAGQFPRARLRVVWRTEPGDVRNPKVAWLKILAPHATGDLWLWSDVDIVAPPGFLRTAREEYAAGAARLLTWPYVVRERMPGPALLDALYVNAEFFPGVLLLRRLGPVDFGLGAALLFAPDDFEASIAWTELGAALADDFVLGQKLRPVRIGRTVLTTSAEVATWRAALLHYLRWNKTIRWNRPFGTAARLAILPVLGWLVYILCRPGEPFGWIGLMTMMQIDVLAAALICRRVGCRVTLHDLTALEFWSLGRALAWLVCWLPWPVIWRGEGWHGPFDPTAQGVTRHQGGS